MAVISNEKINAFLAHFEEHARRQQEREPGWLKEIRHQAIGGFERMGFPTTRDENWRETSIAPVVKPDYVPADPNLVRDEDVTEGLLPDWSGARLVFTNGVLSKQHSRLPDAGEGFQAESLSDLVQKNPAALEPYYARLGSYEDCAFAALNTALARDGAVLWIPPGRVIEQPIHLLFVTRANGQPTASYPRVLVVAGANSRVKIVESHVGRENEVYLNNVVTEMVCGENASIHHVKIQRESESAFHLSKALFTLERDARFSSHSIVFGAALARNEIHAQLQGEGIDCHLNGLYLAHGEQHVDHRLHVDHLKPHCQSHQLFKGILDNRSRGVFRGRIQVHPQAQKTDAYQSNKNILLTKDAEMNTRPQLEIYADDVKCSHGATIGCLDENAIFYMRARGIDKETARSLLIYAFTHEIVEQMDMPEVEGELRKHIVARLPNNHLFEDPS